MIIQAPLRMAILLGGIGLLAGTAAAQSIKPATTELAARGYKLSWHDEFEGKSVNKDEWVFRTGERFWSFQRPENVTVANGLLRVALKKEHFNGSEYTAGGLISKRKFRYGYYEARLRMPPGKGWHSSFWMMANDDSRKLELDVCEQDSINPREYTTNVHSIGPVHKTLGARKIATPDLSAEFHVWGCEYTPNEVRYFFDGKLVDSRDLTGLEPDDLNIWLTAIAAPLGKTDKVDETRLPAWAEFDYVRFFESSKTSKPAKK